MNIYVSETPNFPPNKCIYCGTVRSVFFIDFGINLELHFNPVIYGGPGYEGALILCRDCWENLRRVGSQRVAQFIEAKYVNENINGSTIGSSPEANPAAADDDRAPELDDPEPTSSDSESDSNGSDETVANFAGFFSKH